MGTTSSAPMIVKPMVVPTATGYGGQATNNPAMNQLMQALMKTKRSQLLSNQLPGTTPQSLGLGTGMSDAASAASAPAAAFNLDGSSLA